jgi:hypothetical protein
MRSSTPAHFSMARLAVATAAVLGLVAGVTALPSTAAPPRGTGAAAAQPPHPKSDKDLGQQDRERIAAAQAAGKKTVTLLIAAERDKLGAAADQLRALGGAVLKTDGAVDYLKVEMPVAKAEQAARLSAVEAVDVDGLIPLDDPQPEGAQQPIPQTPPGAIPADRRHPGCPVRPSEPAVGRPRNHDRDPGLRDRPRHARAADHHDRRAQDRRLVQRELADLG